MGQFYEDTSFKTDLTATMDKLRKIDFKEWAQTILGGRYNQLVLN